MRKLRDDLERAGRGAASASVIASHWLGDRLLDMAMWAINLLRDLPLRTGRLLLALGLGLTGLLTAPLQAWWTARRGPGLNRWLAGVPRRIGGWLILLLFRLLDLVGVPELWSLLVRAFSHCSPLTGQEIGAAAAILGSTAIRYTDVRIAEGGILSLIFALNRQRAFSTFHTINLPRRGPHSRDHFDILLHELVHVLQYERAGGLYIAEALYAQRTAGYKYGDRAGLKRSAARGISYRDFNREQQAQLVQDYYLLLRDRKPHEIVATYEPFIEQMKEGRI